MILSGPRGPACETSVVLPAGSVGRNLANKPNVYVSSSAGARWREVSTRHSTPQTRPSVECERSGVSRELAQKKQRKALPSQIGDMAR